MKNNQPREGLKISENSKISQEKAFQTFFNIRRTCFGKMGKCLANSLRLFALSLGYNFSTTSHFHQIFLPSAWKARKNSTFFLGGRVSRFFVLVGGTFV